MFKKLLGIVVLGFFLSGNAYSKVKLQCQGLVEIVEKNIIHVNFDEKFIDILQGSGGNKVSFEVRTIDETHVLSWDRPLEKNAKHKKRIEVQCIILINHNLLFLFGRNSV